MTFLFGMQSESTLWRLKFFVKDALRVQGRGSSNCEENKADNRKPATKLSNNPVSKTKKDKSDALANTAKKRNKMSAP